MMDNSSNKHMHNGIINFSYLKFFLYPQALERDLSYSDYLGFSSCQLGEGQH